MNKKFCEAFRCQNPNIPEEKASWLDWIGQPMLYDTELFVLRRKLETQHEIYRYNKGIPIV